MTTKITAIAALLFVALMCQAQSTQPEISTLPAAEGVEAATDKVKDPEKEKKVPPKKLTEPPANDIFAATPSSSSGEVSMGFQPHMMGDFPGSFSRQVLTILGTQTTATTITTTTPGRFVIGKNGKPVFVPGTTTTTTSIRTTPTTQQRIILTPTGTTLGGFKIADNASPRPVDRVYFTYNFFGDLHGPGSGATDPTNITQQVGNSKVNTFFPGSAPVNANLHREILGFEKTFLDGRASVEMRVPLLQQSSTLNGFGASDIGDLTFITKYAFYLDPQTGNVVSGGLGITAPTGPGIVTIDGTIRSTLLQPWFGYIWSSDRFFINAFHSVVVPTDARDITLLFNDVGLNYWLYRGQPGRLLRSIVPMVEAHVTTPLNHRGPDAAIFVPDLVVMTTGAHIGIGRNTMLSLGVATPVTGPPIYNVEAFMQLNFRY